MSGKTRLDQFMPPKTSVMFRFHCPLSGFSLCGCTFFPSLAMLPFSSRSPGTLRATYTALAPLYALLVPWVSGTARDLGRAWLQVEDGESVLDVGTGTGMALHSLAASNPMGWTAGLDTTPAMIRRARRRLRACPHNRYHLQVGNARALPFPSNIFDAVFSSYLLDILPTSDIRPALQEMHRVMKQKGRLVLVHMARRQPPAGAPWTLIARLCPRLLGGARPIDLQLPLRRAGFTVHKTDTRTQLGLRSTILFATPE